MNYTKGKKRRSTPIADWVIDILRPVLERTEPGEFIFSNAAGSPIDYSNWHKRTWAPAVAAAGLNRDTELDPVVIHTTRHTYATEQLEDGRSLAEIADLLGHASISTTERYAHRRSKIGRAAADVVPDPRLDPTPAPQQPESDENALPSNVLPFRRA